MSGVPGKVSTGAGISLGADGYSTSSGTFSAGTTPPITGALNIDASGYGGTFLAATNTSGSSITMSLDATTNTMTVNGNVVVTGTVSEAAVSEGPLTITGGTVTVSTPFLQATQSWNAAGVTFTGMKVNVTDTASASGSLLQDFQVGGVSKFSITKAGAVTAASNLSVATGAVYQINGTSVLSATTLGSSVVTSSLTTVGTLSAGAVPASLVTAGTFGAGAYTFPGALAITGALTGATTGAFSGLITSTSDTGGLQLRNTANTAIGYVSNVNNMVGTGATTDMALYAVAAMKFYTGNNAAVALSMSGGATPAATFGGTLAINGAFTGATTGTFSSTVNHASTISVGAATPSASGAGVTFPATQSASSDVNTLDDYKEGTWTPVITAATPGNLAVTYGSQIGTYTKIGRAVTVTFYVTTSAFSYTTASGLIYVTGLPYTANGSSFYAMSYFQGYTSVTFPLLGIQLSGTATVYFTKSASGQVPTNALITDFPTGGTVQLAGSFTYYV